MYTVAQIAKTKRISCKKCFYEDMECFERPQGRPSASFNVFTNQWVYVLKEFFLVLNLPMKCLKHFSKNVIIKDNYSSST